MINIPFYIREALHLNDGNNQYAMFLRSYYSELLRKADEHKMIVQTNKDEGLVRAIKGEIKRQQKLHG